MKWIFHILFFSAIALCAYSPEELDAGKKLLSELAAAKRRPVLDQTLLFVRSQSKYAGRLYMSRYQFDDRPLFTNRRLWTDDGLDYKAPSLDKTMELYKISGLDGYATFAWPRQYDRVMKPTYAAAQRAGLKVLPEIAPSPDYYTIAPETLKLIAESPASFRINGKSLISSYVMDALPPEKIKEFRERWRKEVGDTLLFIPQIHFLRLKNAAGKKINSLELNQIYRDNGTLPLSLVNDMRDYLRSYLEVCDGIYLGHPSTRPEDGSWDSDFERDVLFPIFNGVLAEKKYNGKKIFAVMGKTGYTAYYNAQSLSRDGTRTLRAVLDAIPRWMPDLYIGTEWDELNEDTGFQPLVAKPMSSQRILRYYSSKFHGTAPTPLPGDDLSIPNLIISFRQTLVPGDIVHVELLNVPDTLKGENYTVKFELADENGNVLFSAPAESFNTGKLKEKIWKLPGEQFIEHRVLRPRLAIDYRGRKQEFNTGLPFTILRMTTGNKQYFCVPLRNVARPEKAEVAFRGNAVICDVRFGENVASAEVMQNNLEQFAYDPRNEYRRNDADRNVYELTVLFYNFTTLPRNQAKLNFKLLNAPSLLVFQTPSDTRKPAETTSTLPSYQENVDWWSRDMEFSVLKSEAEHAELEVRGEFLAFPYKGQKIFWKIPLAKLGAGGVESIVTPEGLTLTLEANPRPRVIPLPFDTGKVSFTQQMKWDQPDAARALRVVTENGKIWWSDPAFGKVLKSGPSEELQVFSFLKKRYLTLPFPAGRITTVDYIFDPSAGGNILTAPAGREYYAMIGSYQAAATGFQGLEGAYTPFTRAKNTVPMSPSPVWEKSEDGRWCLSFDGKPGKFIMFPNVVLPQSTGFTVKFEVFPRKVDKKRMVLLHHGTISPGGISLEVVNGKFLLIYNHLSSGSTLPQYTSRRFKTDIPLLPNQWQKITVAYDGRKLTLSANGKTEQFPVTGTGLYLQSAHFGGREVGNQWFNGRLRSFHVKHCMEATSTENARKQP